MDTQESLVKLIDLLQLAYSGELAAAHAYRGHAHSVKAAAEKQSLRQIEQEEWTHRRQIAAMLASLEAKPRRLREARLFLIGRTIGLLCHVLGWYIPMYGAGRLESQNVMEYERAAEYASQCRHFELVECLLEMAETEWEHENFFLSKVAGHPWSRFLRPWRPLPPKDSIRTKFAALAVA